MTSIDGKVLKEIYRQMARISAVDVAIRQGLQAGRFAFNYWPMTGQEGIPACVVQHLTHEDYLITTYRGVHDLVAKGVPLKEFFAEALGRVDGINKGKGGAPHISHPQSGVMLTTAIVGAGTPIANGLALAAQLRGQKRVAVVNFGDGASSIGAVHEAMNLAGVWKLPVVFLLQNNQMGEYTEIPDYTATERFVDRAPGYAIKGIRADGNDPVEMYSKAGEAIAWARGGNGAVLLEAVTLRLGPHSGSLPPNHLSKEKLEAGRANAPLPKTRKLLLERRLASESELAAIEAAAKQEVEEALVWALERKPTEGVEELYRDVYADPAVVPRRGRHARLAAHEGEATGESKEMSYSEAIRDAIDLAMAKDREVFLLGEDIAEPMEGVQKTSLGLQKKYGKARIRSTPIAEQAIIGAGMGAALAGMRPICEIMFSDFLGVCLDQIANHVAKQRFMSGGHSSVPLTMRVMLGPMVAGGLGAQHSQSLEAWLLHVPGLKVVYPSTPREAKGLLASCIEDADPCVQLESMKLMFALKGPVPLGEYRIPLGVADVKRRGKDVSILTYGWEVHEALAAATELAKEGIDAEVVDLRSLLPLDYATVLESVRKTGRALVVTAATEFCGLSGEIASTLNETLWREMKLPAQRFGAAYVPISIARPLEDIQVPRAASIAARVREMVQERAHA
jgi:pyruvate/2-oxoglutarate/acetoin dehydrogenase E1 component/TPP-dependent pyruvate/acetoin dehydrogenase alpha subunit